MSNKRNSSIEMLRIICILGIIVMHLYGPIRECLKGVNLFGGIVVNTIFNTGVTIFMLISGYYGINFSISKLCDIEYKVIFYSYLTLLVLLINGEKFGFIEMVSYIFPSLSGNHWYITSYLIIMCLSPYINYFFDSLNKKNETILILILFIFFYISPTFFQADITGDGGKGVINLFTVYLIGRYIAKNKIIIESKKAISYLVLVLFINIGLNYLLSIYKGNFFCPFARDNSIFTLLESVLIFFIFININTYNSAINVLARNVLSIYLFEGCIRNIMSRFIDINKYVYSNYLFIFVLIYSIFIFIVISLIEQLRTICFTKLEKRVTVKIEKTIDYLMTKYDKI